MIGADPYVAETPLELLAGEIDGDGVGPRVDVELDSTLGGERGVCVRTVARNYDEFEYSPYEPPIDGAAEVCLYRKRTINLLRRYGKLSVETGRLPSVLGGLEFRARISSYKLKTFEDAVIFVLDIERCLRELDEYEYEVLARVVLRGETPVVAAYEMHCTSRSVYRVLPEALDKLSKKFLRRGILSRARISPKACQGGKNGVFDLSS